MKCSDVFLPATLICIFRGPHIIHCEFLLLCLGRYQSAIVGRIDALGSGLHLHNCDCDPLYGQASFTAHSKCPFWVLVTPSNCQLISSSDRADNQTINLTNRYKLTIYILSDYNKLSSLLHLLEVVFSLACANKRRINIACIWAASKKLFLTFLIMSTVQNNCSIK